MYNGYKEVNVFILVQNYIKVLLDTSQIKEVLSQNYIILFGFVEIRLFLFEKIKIIFSYFYK